MKALFVTSIADPHVVGSEGSIELREVPVPEPKEDEVRIKVAYASICGSDAHVLGGNLGPIRRRVLDSLPRRMGHEVSGTIDKLGERAAALGWEVGDRITANYRHFCNACYYCHNGMENFCLHPVQHTDAMAEYICWNVSQIYKVPEPVNLLHASMTEPLSIALNAVQVAKVRFGSRVAIVGAGGIGLMAVQLARLAGAAQIAVFDLVEKKRQIALLTGADICLDPTHPTALSEAQSFTQNLGFDCVLECSGASSAAKMALSLISPDGDGVFFSMYQPDFSLEVNLFSELYLSSKHLHGMYTSADCFPRTIAVLSHINFEPIIQKMYPLVECKKAFDDQLTGQYAKIVLSVDNKN